MTEVNQARKLLMDGLIKTPHRDYSQLVPDYLTAINHDPYLGARMMVYTFDNSQIRDQQDAAMIALLQSDPALEFREAGRALFGLDFYETGCTDGFRSLAPYRLFRIWNYIRNSANPGPNCSRQMRVLMTDYLKFLRRDASRYEKVLLLNQNEVRQVLHTYRLPSTPYEQAVIFDDNPPKGSVFYAIKQIGRETDPTRKAELAIEHKLPYTIAASLLPKNDPTAHVALIEAMSPTEAVNSISWVEKSGVLEIPQVKEVFLAKVAVAKQSTASMKHRKSSGPASEEVAQAVEKARDRQAKQAKRIENKTLLIVDRSGSLDIGIEVGKEFAAYIGALFDDSSDLLIVLVNDTPLVLRPRSLALSDLEREFAHIRASGATALGSGVVKAGQEGFEAGQIVIVTDGDENRNPTFASAVMQLYPEAHVSVIAVGSYVRSFNHSLERAGISHDVFEWTGDYLMFDQVGVVLAGERRKTLLEQILEIQLPYIKL